MLIRVNISGLGNDIGKAPATGASAHILLAGMRDTNVAIYTPRENGQNVYEYKRAIRPFFNHLSLQNDAMYYGYPHLIYLT